MKRPDLSCHNVLCYQEDLLVNVQWFQQCGNLLVIPCTVYIFQLNTHSKKICLSLCVKMIFSFIIPFSLVFSNISINKFPCKTKRYFAVPLTLCGPAEKGNQYFLVIQILGLEFILPVALPLY
jgi:hypothetical protein